MRDFQRLYDSYFKTIQTELEKVFDTVHFPEQTVVESAKYSLLNGGKRTRALFTLGFCKLFGGEIKDSLPLACAVEMIHCYSLIHDDLPCMDDDDLRRGQPSNHKVYGEATALLAGDALLTHAFGVIANANLDADSKVQAIQVLSECAGYKGMIGGQAVDLDSEDKAISLEQLTHMHNLKTGAMFQASCVLGALVGKTPQAGISLAQRFSQKIGLAFQVTDDILDVTGTQEELGKPIGSDMDNKKSTFVSLLGLSESKKRAEALSQEAIALLEELPQDENRDFLIALTNNLLVRKN